MKKSSIILKKPIDKGKRPCYNECKFKGIEQNRCNGRKDEVIMKYFVIATHWDDEKKAQAKYIAGEFSSYMNANIFKEAYTNLQFGSAISMAWVLGMMTLMFTIYNLKRLSKMEFKTTGK